MRERERKRERGLPWCLHSPVPPVTVANAVLTSVMTYFAMPPLCRPLQITHTHTHTRTLIMNNNNLFVIPKRFLHFFYIFFFFNCT